MRSLHSWAYIIRNRLTLREHESAIPDLDSSVTIAEAIRHAPTGDMKRTFRRRGALLDEDVDLPDPDDTPEETRKTLKRGVAFPLMLKLTEKRGFSVFAKTAIPKGKQPTGGRFFIFSLFNCQLMLTRRLRLPVLFVLAGSFICEYVGELVPSWEGDRRELDYQIQGLFKYAFGDVLENLVRQAQLRRDMRERDRSRLAPPDLFALGTR